MKGKCFSVFLLIMLFICISYFSLMDALDLESDSEDIQGENNMDEDSSFPIDPAVFQTIRCGAHDVQLSVSDVFKDKNLQTQIGQVRELVKILRKLPYVNSFRGKGHRKPFLDSETRWGYTFLMVDCINSQMEFITSLLTCELKEKFNEEFWIFTKNFVTSVKPLYILTKRIQEQHLTCGDFYL